MAAAMNSQPPAAEMESLRHAMREKGLTEVRFRFDFEGTRVLNQ